MANSFPSGGGGGGSSYDDAMQKAYYNARLQEYLMELKRRYEMEDMQREEAQAAYLQQTIPNAVNQSIQGVNDLQPDMRASMEFLKNISAIGSPALTKPIGNMLVQNQAGLISAGTPTEKMKERLYSMRDPGFEEFALMQRQGQTPAALQAFDRIQQLKRQGDVEGATTLEQMVNPRNPDIKREVSAAEKMGKDYGEDYQSIKEGERTSYQTLTKLKEIDSLLGDSYTGTAGSAVKNVQKLAHILGVNVDGLGEKEASEALSQQLALSFRNPAEGAGMPGSLSDSDREFLLKMVPSLDMTPMGRRKLIKIYEKIYKRQAEIGNSARDFVIENGSLNPEWDKRLFNIRSNSIFLNDEEIGPSSGDSNTISWEELRRRRNGQ